MEELTHFLHALRTEDASSGSRGSKLTKSPALDSPTTPRLSLETLPMELQRRIMCNAPDLTSLSALIHASPKLHRVYAEHRTSVLRDIVTQTLQGIEVDALAAYRSGTEAFQKARTKSLLWALVEEQQVIHSAQPLSTAGDWTLGLSLDDIINILRFHVSIVEFLTEAFASWALGDLPSTPENKAAYKSGPLSDTERSRIQRAFYRMQMFCNLCGSQDVGRSAPERIEERVERTRVLSIFSAWEVEEILSVHQFAKDHYENVFKQVAWDLNEERNPKYRHIDMTSVNEDLMLTMETRDGRVGKYPSIHTIRDPSLTRCIVMNEASLNTVLEYGLHLLAQTIKEKSQEQLVEIIRTAITSSKCHGNFFDGSWLDEAQDDMAQYERREEWPNLRDSAQNSRQKMPFDRDKLDSPPLAWILFWRGEYSNLFGWYIPEALRRWGYVMWDAARLDSDARDAIEHAWCWNSYNASEPRSWDDDYESSVVSSP